MSFVIEKKADLNDENKRFDVVARAAFPDLPLSQVFRAIRSGKLTLNRNKTKPQVRVRAGDTLQYHGDYVEKPAKKVVSTLHKSAIPILWQDENFLIVNKPRNLKTHDGQESVQAWVLSYLGEGSALSFSPGPCHRLDRQTSGVLAFAKTAHGARIFADCQNSDALVKIYLGVLSGIMREETFWEHRLLYDNHRSRESQDGLLAGTHVIPIASKNEKTLAFFILKTGRTHQIRSQAALSGHPLYGDYKYGGCKNGGGYFLHAVFLKNKTNLNSLPIFPEIFADPSDTFKRQIHHFGRDMQSIKKLLKKLF